MRIPKRRRRRWPYMLLGLLLIAAALVVWALYNGLVTTRYALHSPKLTNVEPIRIVAIADLHDAVYGENQAELLDRILALQPDLILLAGDIADDGNPLAGAMMLVDGVSKMVPCYYVTGSHDLWRPDIAKLKRAFEREGVEVLEGEICPITVKGQLVNICGLDDPTIATHNQRKAYLKALKVFSALPDNAYNLLVAHRPDYIDSYCEYPFDLVVSGHTHGGQVRIPLLLNGLYAPDQGWFPKYAGGLYQVGSAQLLVSRGVSYDPDLPRIFNPPEIVLIELSR